MKQTKCYDIENLSLYSVGGGSEKWRHAVEEHLDECGACKVELAALRGAGDLLSSMPTGEAPDRWRAISARLEPRKTGWLSFPALYRASAYAVAVIALIAIGIFAGTRYTTPTAQRTQVARQSAAAKQSQEQDHDAALVQSHVTLAWNDPFSDSASLAVLAAEDGRSN